MRPDVDIKNSPNYPKVGQKAAAALFTRKLMFFKIAQKATINLDTVVRNFVTEHFYKVAQSGHTASNQDLKIQICASYKNMLALSLTSLRLYDCEYCNVS